MGKELDDKIAEKEMEISQLEANLEKLRGPFIKADKDFKKAKDELLFMKNQQQNESIGKEK